MKILQKLILTQLLLVNLLASVIAQTPILSQRDIFSPVAAKNGMVVTAEPIATQIGIEVLKQGGNAIDAAVTIGFVMAVTYPWAGNIGGGGFMLVHLAKTAKIIAIIEKQPLYWPIKICFLIKMVTQTRKKAGLVTSQLEYPVLLQV